MFDLVRVREEKIKLAFYFALRDTVVADSLDQASRIAYGQDKKWGRVVTLKVLPPPSQCISTLLLYWSHCQAKVQLACSECMCQQPANGAPAQFVICSQAFWSVIQAGPTHAYPVVLSLPLVS